MKQKYITNYRKKGENMGRKPKDKNKGDCYRRHFQGSHNELFNLMWLKRSKLLNMMYTSTELSEELGIQRQYLTENLVKKFGLPSEKDEKGRLWFHGLTVAKWVDDQHGKQLSKKRDRQPYRENEFYCLRCKKRIFTEKYNKVKPKEGNKLLLTAKCPDCGMTVNKYSSEVFK